MSTDTITNATHGRTSPLAFIYRWLFDPEFKDGYQRPFDHAIAFLIVCSVFAVVLETVPEIFQPHAAAFHTFDVVTVAIFSIEYLLRVLTAPLLPEYANSRYPRLRYILSPYALIAVLSALYIGGTWSTVPTRLRITSSMRAVERVEMSPRSTTSPTFTSARWLMQVFWLERVYLVRL